MIKLSTFFLILFSILVLTWVSPGYALTLTATTGNGAVYLNWTQNTDGGLTGYRIYYGPAPGNYTGTEAVQGTSPISLTLAQVPDPTQPAYVIGGLSTGVTWHFKVYALLGSLETDPSNEATATPYGWGRLSGNPLQNSGFEEDGAYWFYEGQLWTPDFGRPVTALIDTNIRYAGNKALKIMSDFPVGTSYYKISSFQDPPKAPNTDYLVRFWAKATDAEAASFFLILDMDDNWGDRLFIQKGTYEWTQFARTYNTGPGNDFRISLVCQGPGTIWVDNIEVIPLSGGEVTTPYPETLSRYAGNPILDIGGAGSLDQTHAYNPNVVHDPGSGKLSGAEDYKMYYAMHDGTSVRTGLATSPDGYIWTKYAGNPVLNLGAGGSWDQTHVIPSSILKVGTVYHLYYHGYDGSMWRIGQATSDDGKTWARDPNNPLLTPGDEGPFTTSHVLCGNVLYDEGQYKMWYCGYGTVETKYHIFYATSPDGSTFTRQGLALAPGGLGQMDDAGSLRPVVLRMPDDTYTMWYTGITPLGNTGCYATSEDGLSWTAVGGAISPSYQGSASFDTAQANPCSVLLEGDVIRMWYYGYSGANHRIGLAEMVYSATGEPTATPTEGTPLPTNTPTQTPTPTETSTPTLTPTSTSTPIPPTSTPTATPRPGMEIFQSGDAIIDFSVQPDGSALNGEQPDLFSPGTYLMDQFASVGVRFRSTVHPNGSTLTGIGVGVVGGPSNNQILGMLSAPPSGLDGRVIYEIQFDEPVKRAGVLRRGYLNFSTSNAITNFYNESGGLITSIETTEDYQYISHEVGDGQPGIKRIEITSTNTPHGAGGVDDVMFSPVGDLEVPEALWYGPYATATPTEPAQETETPTPTATATSEPGVTSTPHPADINEDGHVDHQDLFLLQEAWKLDAEQ